MTTTLTIIVILAMLWLAWPRAEKGIIDHPRRHVLVTEFHVADRHVVAFDPKDHQIHFTGFNVIRQPGEHYTVTRTEYHP